MIIASGYLLNLQVTKGQETGLSQDPLRKQSKVFQKPEGTNVDRPGIHQDPPDVKPSPGEDPNSRGELEVKGTFQNCFQF